MIRLDIYKDNDLAATLEYRRPPIYRGVPGQQVRALIERPHEVRNLWTGQTVDRAPTDQWHWWAANIFSAGLTKAGFQVRFSMPVAVPSRLTAAA